MAQSYPTADFVTSTVTEALTAATTDFTIAASLDIPATDGVLQIDYDSTLGVGVANGPETIKYATYTTATGAVSLTSAAVGRGQGGTTAVAHDAGAPIQCGTSSIYWQELSAGAVITDWAAAGETWTYATAVTFTISGDETDKYSAGMKIRFVNNGSTKYFIITKVAYGAPNTTVTIYGGTDYTLTSAAITEPYYSTTKSPYGFPLNPTKWTVEETDTSDDATAGTPIADAWVNSIDISIPLGVWKVEYSCAVGAYNSAVVGYAKSTLSTANNSESDVDFTRTVFMAVYNASKWHSVYASKVLNLAAADIYYLNYAPGGAGYEEAGIYGSSGHKTIIRATCAYL